MDRKEALMSGHIRYNTKKPCKNGHLADRYSKSGACVNCIQDLVKKSNSIYVTMGDMVNANSKLVYLFSKQEDFPLIKMLLDCYVAAKFTDVNPDFINPFPFKSARHISQDVYRIRVRVPLDNVEAMLEMGKNLVASYGTVRTL